MMNWLVKFKDRWHSLMILWLLMQFIRVSVTCVLHSLSACVTKSCSEREAC
jgi:hypothetical protein